MKRQPGLIGSCLLVGQSPLVIDRALHQTPRLHDDARHGPARHVACASHGEIDYKNQLPLPL
jgi:hypothetical protein